MTLGEPSEDLAAEIARGGGRSENIQVRGCQDGEPAPEYVFGVVHMNSDGTISHVQSHRTRREAEFDRQACAVAECFLARVRLDSWEKVPNGE